MNLTIKLKTSPTQSQETAEREFREVAHPQPSGSLVRFPLEDDADARTVDLIQAVERGDAAAARYALDQGANPLDGVSRVRLENDTHGNPIWVGREQTAVSALFEADPKATAPFAVSLPVFDLLLERVGLGPLLRPQNSVGRFLERAETAVQAAYPFRAAFESDAVNLDSVVDRLIAHGYQPVAQDILGTTAYDDPSVPTPDMRPVWTRLWADMYDAERAKLKTSDALVGALSLVGLTDDGLPTTTQIDNARWLIAHGASVHTLIDDFDAITPESALQKTETAEITRVPVSAKIPAVLLKELVAFEAACTAVAEPPASRRKPRP